MKTLKFVTYINSVVAGLQPQVKKKYTLMKQRGETLENYF